jgi:transcriptional regulator with XRE-family HTH domain
VLSLALLTSITGQNPTRAQKATTMARGLSRLSVVGIDLGTTYCVVVQVFVDRIRELRIEGAIDLDRDIARKAGVSPAALSRFLNGRHRSLSIDYASALGKALGLSICMSPEARDLPHYGETHMAFVRIRNRNKTEATLREFAWELIQSLRNPERGGRRTLDDIAQEIGVNKSALSRFMSNKSGLHMASLDKLLRCCGVTVAAMDGSDREVKYFREAAWSASN